MSFEVLQPLLATALDNADGPLFVGLDGRSGAGKSTLAARVATDFGPEVTVIEGDEFYSGGSGETWDSKSVEDKVAWAMDWRRQLRVLTELRVNGSATWRPFDWEAQDWDSDCARLADTPVHTGITRLVLLEGAYSCRPELHDALDMLVLLDPPADVRRSRLLGREGDAYRSEWEGRWSAAEDHYFGAIMTPDRFDIALK